MNTYKQVLFDFISNGQITFLLHILRKSHFNLILFNRTNGKSIRLFYTWQEFKADWLDAFYLDEFYALKSVKKPYMRN